MLLRARAHLRTTSVPLKRRLASESGSVVGSKKQRTALAQQASNRPSATLLIEEYTKSLSEAIFDNKSIGETLSPDARFQLILAFARSNGVSPIAAAASVERLNSVATDMLTRKRYRLGLERFEKMVLIRSWIAALSELGIEM
ncbi:uncharacterized protein AMSG_09519 [Thecamonas trahens ATCC 50062]|uniref:Uncharacterized protein n=1 Tax=Thecamonas trahens ATCC 50062 TaxID=461836 RepID=A0A0L0DNB1_THETB|nr:hypothetical protein AMSG_09519 [Thecamonas trahens ATCC 50062]KNC53797.1 hypothetical protein AMSG_09519 [Thecamonas trahens ATCC 50062]|eukprot:XP_013754357.1 hypothetical protein AMSG_09519 [Thecamonas trahens ATCC 50062]